MGLFSFFKKKKFKEEELDDFIERLQSVPDEYRKDLTSPFGVEGAIVRTIGAGDKKLACLFLILPKNHFKTQLSDDTIVKVRLPVTETPYGMIISSCVRTFDSPNPGIDEHYHFRDHHLKLMIQQNYTYLIIADQTYGVYFRRRIGFDINIREDLYNIGKAFERYGEQKAHPNIGDDPNSLRALEWYQKNVNMQDLIRNYFTDQKEMSYKVSKPIPQNPSSPIYICCSKCLSNAPLMMDEKARKKWNAGICPRCGGSLRKY